MIAQWVKLLLHKHEGLTLVPQLLCKELDVVSTHVTHVCKPVLEHRIERWGLLASQSSQTSELQVQRETASQKIR